MERVRRAPISFVIQLQQMQQRKSCGSSRLGFILGGDDNIKEQGVYKAVSIAGSLANLSHYLKVPQSVLMTWIAGEAEPTTAAFLAVVDLLSDDDPHAFLAAKQKADSVIRR